MKNNTKQNGSALIVVLGLLAVVMFMAIAFSISMRTERSGTTNLRHSLSAKQTMQTAISQVMESIDRSFGNPTNNMPVPEWDPPHLTSKTFSPYYTNGAVSTVADRPTNAKVLTQEISRHLSPAQLALAKNAKVEWVPLKSGVDASATAGGRPSEDKVVGRYAFIALNTTGLLDMNLAGGGLAADRLKDYGTNSVNYQIAGSTFIKDNSTFIATRDSKGGFTSYADMWRILGAKDYIADPDLAIVTGTSNPFEIKPDLFNTFSTSVEDLAPDGSMKIPLVVPADPIAKKNYAKRALAAFKKMFAENKDTDTYNNSKLPKLTRAQLATQALVDYLDADAIPSGGIDPDALPGFGVLDYPCTEPVPMVSYAVAFFDVPADTDAEVVKTVAADAGTWFKVYDVTFTLAVEAIYLNDKVPVNLAGKNYTLKVDYVMTDFSDAYNLLWADPAGWVIEGDLGSWETGTKSESKVIASSPDRIVSKVEKTFKVKAKPITWDNSTTPPTVTAWHKFSKLEEDLPNESLRTRVRISAEVSSGAVVQQIPAPKLKTLSGAIDADINDSKDYYIMVQPALYHNPAERAIRNAGAERFEMGWALCVDPRFAYNTESFVDVETDYAYWLYEEFAHYYSQAGGDAGYRRIAQELIDGELRGDIDLGLEYGNFLINRILLDQTETKANLAQMIKSLSGNKGMVPDSYHAFKNTGDMFIKLDQVQPMIQQRVANAPMITAGELGSLVVGPWETLSLFSVFRPDNKKSFHRAVDYFGVGEARFPTTADIGGLDITAIDKEHFPTVHSGRVNLNPQRIVQFEDDVARDAFLGDTDPAVIKSNYEPVVAVLTGAAIGADPATPDVRTPLPRPLALEIAQAFYEEADLDADLMIRKVSDFGGLLNVAGDENPILRVLQANETPLKIDCDAHREAFLANSIGGFTTRGQTYTVILRADAYSPRYGSDSAGDGTTMASTHALVELWRDPEPCRRPDGKLFPLNTETPTHNWYIRSVRWF